MFVSSAFRLGPALKVTGCGLRSNTAQAGGGGLYALGTAPASNPTVEMEVGSTTYAGNTVRMGGGV